ncbi:MAG: hypothetical protein B6U89_06275, partial [Desulfurococcales archaeon ex4484_58]
MWKPRFLSILFLFLMLLNGTIVESIVVRNDEYYPSSSSLIKYDELYNMIEKLRKLNDTILNNY